MSLFNRNKSGQTFDGKESDRKGFIDVVSWNMEEDELVYKFPHNNLTTGGVIIVNPSQTAILFINGEPNTVFGSGRHEIKTANIPFVQRLLNIPTGGETTFPAEVWFVNTGVEKQDERWAATELSFMDPYYKIPLELRARGVYGYKISDPEIFIKKIVGNRHSLTTEDVQKRFWDYVNEGVKDHMTIYMEENGLSVTHMGGHYKKIAGHVEQILIKKFQQYGVEIIDLAIENISFNKDDERYLKAIERDERKKELEDFGSNYERVTSREAITNLSKNEGMAGGAMGAGMGMGMGFNMANMMGNMMGQPQNQQTPPSTNTPPPIGSASTPPPINVAEFHIASGGQTYGPYTFDQMKQFAEQNTLTKESMVWKAGMPSWVAAKDMAELQPIFNPTSNTPPPPPPPPIG